MLWNHDLKLRHKNKKIPLHRNEMILPAHLAQDMRQTFLRGFSVETNNFHISTPDEPETFGEALMAAILMFGCIALIGAMLLMLFGCASVPVAAPPQIVRITRTVYAPVPAAYLVPCLIPVGTPATNQELLLLEQAAMTDLLACNAQLLRIKELPPP